MVTFANHRLSMSFECAAHLEMQLERLRKLHGEIEILKREPTTVTIRYTTESAYTSARQW